MSEDASGELHFLPLAELLLDWNNPRLPVEMQDKDKTQEDLALYINKHYDPVRIADSIARHEFFRSEPLIAVQAEDHYTVIEGNRRLTALKGLSDPELRGQFAAENSAWSRLPEITLPDSFPVVVVPNEKAVAPLLGFRHISGIEPWEPYAQARYIARLVNDDNLSLAQVSDLVGRDLSEVRAMYRDYDILEQAQVEFGIDTQRARGSFGVFSNAMGRRGVQHFIGATQPRFVNPENYPLADSSKPRVRELLKWIFGSARGEGRVIRESRQLGDLARVLSDPVATDVLRSTSDLAEALDALTDRDAQFAKALSQTLRAVRKIENLGLYQTADASRQWREVEDAVAQIRDLLGREE